MKRIPEILTARGKNGGGGVMYVCQIFQEARALK